MDAAQLCDHLPGFHLRQAAALIHGYGDGLSIQMMPGTVENWGHIPVQGSWRRAAR